LGTQPTYECEDDRLLTRETQQVELVLDRGSEIKKMEKFYESRF